MPGRSMPGRQHETGRPGNDHILGNDETTKVTESLFARTVRRRRVSALSAGSSAGITGATDDAAGNGDSGAGVGATIVSATMGATGEDTSSFSGTGPRRDSMNVRKKTSSAPRALNAI